MSEEMAERQAFAIGAISNLFGMRMGTYAAWRLFNTMGIREVQGKNKPEQIKYVLTKYANDSSRLVQILNTLIRYHKLTEDEYNELDNSVRALGLKIENHRVVTSTPTVIIYGEPAPFDAFKDIERIMLSAKSQICMIDPYVDKTLFSLYFADVPRNISIRLLTNKMSDKFEEVAKRFKIQKSNFEVRTNNKIHDRYILIDKRPWVIGQSIKNAGKKPLSIVELTDARSALALFETLWKRSTVFI